MLDLLIWYRRIAIQPVRCDSTNAPRMANQKTNIRRLVDFVPADSGTFAAFGGAGYRCDAIALTKSAGCFL
ncbi:hypothetical protein [Kingella kingae]|uniref:hypothetical protein n=1 Tax=Kingella kingae TaxID=504 RepID=UPI001E2C5186|nr:hypothetical protein [Kingella kingae]